MPGAVGAGDASGPPRSTSRPGDEDGRGGVRRRRGELAEADPVTVSPGPQGRPALRTRAGTEGGDVARARRDAGRGRRRRRRGRRRCSSRANPLARPGPAALRACSPRPPARSSARSSARLANSGGWFLGGAALAHRRGRRSAPASARCSASGDRPPVARRRRHRPTGCARSIFLAPGAARSSRRARRARRPHDLPQLPRAGGARSSSALENYRSIFGDRTIFTLDGVGRHLHQPPVPRRRSSSPCVGRRASRSCGRGPAAAGVDLGGAGARACRMGTAAVLVVLAAVGALRGVIWNNLFWVVFVTGVQHRARPRHRRPGRPGHGRVGGQVAHLHADGDQLRRRQRDLALRLRLHARRPRPDRPAQRRVGRRRRRAAGVDPAAAVEHAVPDRRS